MSVPHSTEWPIRVGGMYVTIGDTGIYRKVTEIAGEFVYSDRFHADGIPCMKRPGDRMSIKTFRAAYRPEDQSPIPALVAALKAALKTASPHVKQGYRQSEDGQSSEFVQETTWPKWYEDGKAALALAGETEGEDRNAE